MLTAKNVSKHLKVNKKPIKHKKTASPVSKHNGIGLIKEQEARYVEANKQIIVSKASYHNA